MNKKITTLLSIFMLLSFILSACGAPPPSETELAIGTAIGMVNNLQTHAAPTETSADPYCYSFLLDTGETVAVRAYSSTLTLTAEIIMCPRPSETVGSDIPSEDALSQGKLLCETTGNTISVWLNTGWIFCDDLTSAPEPAAEATEAPIESPTPNVPAYTIKSIRCPGEKGMTDYTVVSEISDFDLSCGEGNTIPFAALYDGETVGFEFYSDANGYPSWDTATNGDGEEYHCISGIRDEPLRGEGKADAASDYANMICNNADDTIRVLATLHPGPGPQQIGMVYLGHMYLDLICTTGTNTVEFTGFTMSLAAGLQITEIGHEPVQYAVDNELCVEGYCFVNQTINDGVYLDVWAEPGQTNCLADWMQNQPTPVPDGFFHA